jgi:acyl carrier protein
MEIYCLRWETNMFNNNTIRYTGYDTLGSIPTTSPIKIRVFELVRSALPSDVGSQPISGDERLSDLGLTSLRFISLVILLEDEFGLNERFLEQLNVGTTIDSLVVICEASVRYIDSAGNSYC